MNRQHTPPNLNILGLSPNTASMGMNRCLSSQTRPIPKTSSRERRSGLANVGLATVLEGLDGLGIGTLFTFYFNTYFDIDIKYIHSLKSEYGRWVFIENSGLNSIPFLCGFCRF